jgi:tetratricopeptide (TPR) repeat protein
MRAQSAALILVGLVLVLCDAAAIAKNPGTPSTDLCSTIDDVPEGIGLPTLSRLMMAESPKGKIDPAGDHLKRALAALSSKHYAEAYELLEPLSRGTPTNPQIWTAQGMALAGLGRLKESLACYERALALQRDFLPALEGAAEVEYRTGQPHARASLERILVLKPNDPTAHAMLGVLAYERKDCGTAIAHFKQSQGIIGGNGLGLAQYGQCLVSLGQAEKAIEVFQRLVALEPENSTARYNLGLCQIISHDNRAAIATLHRAAKNPTPDPDELNLLAAAYEADHQTDAAILALQKATEIAPNAVKNYLDLATLCMEHDAYALGIEVASAGIRNIPDSAALYTMRGILHAQFMQLAEAEKDFNRANQLDPDQVLGTLGLGITYLQRGSPEKTAQVLRNQLARAPDDPALNYHLAEALLQNGIEPSQSEFTEARQALLRSIAAKPDFAKAHAQLGKIYLLSGDNKRALEECRLAAKLAPNDRMAIYGLVRALRQLGMTEEASPLLVKLRDIDAQELKAEAEKGRVRLIKAVPSRPIEH